MNKFALIALLLPILAIAAESSAPTESSETSTNVASELSETKASDNKSAETKPAEKKAAAAKLEPLSMSVMGTQDAPKVLYIVPWKTVDAVPQEPYASSLLDEVFAPVDPVEFERSIRVHNQIQNQHKADSK